MNDAGSFKFKVSSLKLEKPKASASPLLPVRATHASPLQLAPLRIGVLLALVGGSLLAGCDALRFAPSEQLKQNAWLHERTTAAAAETAQAEASSAQLQALTELSERQSRAFTAYCGLPEAYPAAEGPEQILDEANWRLAGAAATEAALRPDPWQVADSAFEVALGLAAVLGGVYGTRAVTFLRSARAKSQALKEVIEGNELFKEQNERQAAAFKAAHQRQSPATRQLVTALKG